MKTKHTKGEWKIEGDLDDIRITAVVPHNTNVIRQIAVVKCQDTHIPNYEQSQADAKLIAAAPELLEQLSELTELIKGVMDLGALNGMSIKHAVHEVTHKAKLVIEKANQ